MSDHQQSSNLTDEDRPADTRKPRSLLRKVARTLVMFAAVVVVILVGGLVYFTSYVLMASEKTPDAADAIVVVTGGAGRLERAVSLLNQGLGKKLLISGVHPGYTNKILQKRYKLTASQINCCVELDSQALNTVANATQTALWAHNNDYQSLIIVTSAYHMPRTMLEMYRAAPELRYQGHIVTRSDGRSLIARLFDLNNFQLLSKEYGKLLASLIYVTTERLGKKKTASASAL
ncbi:YdcF family protein [uncultured Cohaesibacter sp.]|uniref:YdcF family protein n=1 Tax=uncultured Cohaesibacter sp. TaxID=1002546 RepID=UPI0029C6477B|nr:YdcF family protein [uncultured Cohaesibacter sp.]